MKIASGIFVWGMSERRSNRYGYIGCTHETYDNDVHTNVYLNEDFHKLLGKRVRMTCVVKEARKSGHCGDMFLKIFPSMPEVGTEFVLGYGIFDWEQNVDWDGDCFGLIPMDGREKFWMDPRTLYQLHDQTVEIYVTESSADPLPVYVPNEYDSSIAIGTGDSLQWKGERAKVTVVPNITKIDDIDGCFLVEPPNGELGKTFKIKE